METLEARQLAQKNDRIMAAVSARNQLTAARNAVSRNKSRFETTSFPGIENAPSGHVRVEHTNATLENGRRRKMTIFHAVFGNERKVCTNNDDASRWLAERRVVWAEKTAKKNALIKAQAATRVASQRITDATQAGMWALTSGQVAIIQAALAAISDATDALRQEG